MSPSRRSAVGRHSIRLRGYDYSYAGGYFVTIVAQNRAPRFGRIANGRMLLSEAGSMVHSVLADLDSWHPRVRIDVFQVMPDHIHAIVVLCRVPATTLTTQSVTSRGSSHRETPYPAAHVVARGSSPRETPYPTVNVVAREIALPDIVRHIESLTTARYRHAVTDHGWSRFSGPLSQRNSYACIIRNDRALANIRHYIRANPSNWIETPRWR